MSSVLESPTISLERTVPFGHCDPAGILYTPRALDYCLEAIDEFWKSVLDGAGWYELNMDRDRGTPFVRVELEFRTPITPRSPLQLSAKVADLGSTSVTFAVESSQNSVLCFVARLTSVIVVKSKMAKVGPDDWLRTALVKALTSG